MSIAQRLVNLSDGLTADGVLSTAKGGTGTTTGASVPTISAIGYGGDDTATNPAGGATITLTGTNFAAGAKVLINTTAVGVVTVVSSTQITFTAPALSAGSYILYVVNLDGSTAIAVPGIQYSGTPAWTTAAGTLGTNYETAPVSTTVSAASDSPVTYSVVSGTLPSGVTINSSGTISGTSPAVGGSTTYTFTVRATDAELQDTDRQFSLTINPDVVTWSSSNAFALEQNSASTTTLSATSAAGQTVSYSVDTLPAGLTLSGATVSGTATAGGTTTTVATATAAVTGKTAQQTITWTVSIAADAYFKYTTLLLNAETVVAPFLADASTNNFSLTAFGDTKPSNFGPYTPGYYSNYWNGSSSRLIAANATSNDLSTGDWTIEGWVNQTTRDGGQYDSFFMYDQNSGFNAGMYMTIGAASFTFLVANAAKNGWSVNIDVGTGNLPALNTWAHIAITRSGSIFTVWVNGVSKGTATYSGAINTRTGSVFQVGYSGTIDSYFHGYISNFRVVKGTAVYTSAFTPPTQPLTAITGTALLLSNSNRRIDASGNNITVTWDGDASTMPVMSFDPFQPNSSYATYGSTYFDGSGDYLSVAGSSALDFGTGDFTIECWVNPVTLPADCFIIASTGTGGLFFGSNGGLFGWGKTSIEWTYRAGTPTLGTWQHVALSRSGTSMRLFVNGTQVGTTQTNSVSYNLSVTSTTIGSLGTDYYWNGYISNLRVVKGTAVYTADFTPPTQPLTAVAGTSLLTCQTNQPHTNSQFLDNSTSALTITRSGNATQGSFSPYGANWSNYFDGSGDYLSMPSAATTYLAANPFTIEAWVYPTTDVNGVIIGRRAEVTARGFWFSYGNVTSKKFSFYAGDTNNAGWEVTLTTTNTFEPNQWYHVAVTRDASNIFTIWVNGVSQVTTTASFTMGDDSSTLYIGIVDAVNGPFTGYISNVRLVQNTALYTTTFTPSTTPLTPVTGTGLLTCQSPNLVDNSLNASTITKAGDTRVERFSPFGTVTQTPVSHSVYFDGSGDYLSIAGSSALDFGTGDFTVEAWINRTAYTSGRQNPIIGRSDSGFTFGVLQNQASNGTVDQGKIGITVSDTVIVMGTTVTQANQWYHVAVSRSGTTLRIFVNGVLEGSATYSTAVSLQSSQIGWNGYDYSWDTRYFNGYISNVRAIKGTAIYTATFTTPTTALTAVAGTSLLTCQDATIRDNSANNFTLTALGNAAPRRQNPFGYTTSSAQDYTPNVFGASAYYDGAGDSIASPQSATFNLSSGNWTIEAWYYSFSVLGQSARYLTITPSSGSVLGVLPGSGGFILNIFGSSSPISTSIPATLNAWQHIALVKNGSTTTLYINGVAGGSGTPSWVNADTTIFFGGNTGSYAYDYSGYISDARVVKGTALYTNNFVPPTQPLQAVQNTTLLLNMDKAAIQDKSGKVVAETVGDAKISTSVKKYGLASLYFDGTGDYLYVPSTTYLSLGTGDFTAECWVYPSSSVTADQGLLYLGGNSTYAAVRLGIATNGVYLLCSSAGNSWAVQTGVVGTITLNTWTHIAVTRSGSSFRLFVNGTQVGTTQTSSASLMSGFNYVGTYQNTSFFNFTGYMDDVRVTTGYARYTANFTPPAQALLTK